MRPKAVVEAWVEAFNAADADRISALYAEDAVNHQVMFEPIVGRAAIHAMFTREFGALDMHCIPEMLHEAADWAILEWRDPQGLRGCGFFQVKDDRIVMQRGYWDRQSLAQSRAG